jgi:proteic killer suppression protein
MAILSFSDEDTRELFEDGSCPSEWRPFKKVALRKLDVLDKARDLRDLKSPGNSLEKLERNRKGQHSIRISKKWRVCFVWTPDGPKNVEIVNYH